MKKLTLWVLPEEEQFIRALILGSRKKMEEDLS